MLSSWEISTKLRDKMKLTLVAARKLEELQQLQGKPTPYSMKTPIIPNPSPDSMDINVIQFKLPFSSASKTNPSTTLAKFGQECCKQGLCFNWLQLLNNNCSTMDGFHFPNNGLSLNYKMNCFQRQSSSKNHATDHSVERNPQNMAPNSPNLPSHCFFNPIHQALFIQSKSFPQGETLFKEIPLGYWRYQKLHKLESGLHPTPTL